MTHPWVLQIFILVLFGRLYKNLWIVERCTYLSPRDNNKFCRQWTFQLLWSLEYGVILEGGVLRESTRRPLPPDGFGFRISVGFVRHGTRVVGESMNVLPVSKSVTFVTTPGIEGERKDFVGVG